MHPDLVRALIALGGGLIGVALGVHLQRQSSRARLAFDLHAEFNNFESARARTRAARALRENPKVTYKTVSDELPEESVDIWHIVRFYQKLWIAVKYNHIQRNVVPDLFGSIFFWWYERHFSTKLVGIGYESSLQIEELREWFEATEQAPIVDGWKRRALIQ
jgi:hypothetical protein